MAGKARPTSQIKQLLRLRQPQCGIKTIARRVGISKNAVKSYVSKLSQITQPISELLTLEDPVRETRFHGGSSVYKDLSYEHMSNKLDYYYQRTQACRGTPPDAWEEYIRAYPQGYSYSQFCFHLTLQLVTRRPTMLFHHEPADCNR